MTFNSVTDFRLKAIPSGSFNDIPTAVIESHLSGAFSLINSNLRVHHSLPMNTGSYAADLMSLYDAEIVIASYRLMQYRGFKPNLDGTYDKVTELRYIEIMEPTDGFLARIAQGKVLFPQEADNTPAISEGRPKVYGTTVTTSGILLDSSGRRLV